MPKNVFEIMPILMSLTFWPRSLRFFSANLLFDQKLSGETEFFELHINGGILFAKGKIEFILFHTEMDFAFVCFLFLCKI